MIIGVQTGIGYGDMADAPPEIASPQCLNISAPHCQDTYSHDVIILQQAYVIQTQLFKVGGSIAHLEARK